MKDESLRFGLNAFKSLGASYAIYRWLARYLAAESYGELPPQNFYQRQENLPPGTVIFCTATDGNHGRAVAWAANRLGQGTQIFVPEGTALPRVTAIKSEGAEVHVVAGSYDDAVHAAAETADKHGWVIISDTAWAGYVDIPRWIMAGYLTLFEEIHELETTGEVDIVFLPAGVGSLAASAAWYYRRINPGASPKLVLVEPTAADCFLRSINSATGEIISSPTGEATIMAGLNCPTPSILAWPMLKQTVHSAIAVSDDWTKRAMRTLYHPRDHDRRITSGESGAAGMAALLAICESEDLLEVRGQLGLTRKATVLLLNTEGDTDPYSFRRAVMAQR